MGAKIGGIIIGAVEIIVGAILSIYGGSGVPLIVAGVATVAGSALAIAFQPKANSPQAANSSQIKFANANEGFPLPIVFGEGKVIPNFMNWSSSQFSSKANPAGGGGKGGGTGATSGFSYFLTFECGYCMGPIDEIGQVISVPGDILMRGNKFKQTNVNILNNDWFLSQAGTTATAHGGFAFDSSMVGAQVVFQSGVTAIIISQAGSTAVLDYSQTIAGESFQIYAVPDQIIFTTDDPEEFTLQGGLDSTNSNLLTDGGLVRVYPGASTQTRIVNSDPYFQNFTNGQVGPNYRNICWALFIDYQIGINAPVPKTYQFIVRRLPKVLRDDGSTVAGLYNRGSADATNPSYYQANPAAIIYEILTNKLWGRGCSSDIIDEASFIYASAYYRSKNLGMSLVMDSPEKLTAFLDGIRGHLKSILSWKNGLWTLRCLLDPQTVAGTILTLTSDEVEALQVTRPLWPQTQNDLRCEFVSRRKLYKPDIVHVQDVANVQLTDRVNSQNISLACFAEWNLAVQQAWRVLREMSYPLMLGTFYINRFHSQIEVGDCIRLQWNEWGDDAVTAYFDVVKLEPQGKDDERIKVTVVENIFICPVAGIENSVTLPTVQSWEKVQPVPDTDIYLFGDVGNPYVKLLITPITAFELPAIFTGGDEQTLFVGQSYNPGFNGMDVYWTQGTRTGDLQPFLSIATGIRGSYIAAKPQGEEIAPSATLSTAISTIDYFDRSLELCQFTINNTLEDASWLEINTITKDSDSLEDLADNGNWFAYIGEEIIKIGCVERISGNTFRMRNVIRGFFGTPISPHPIGAILYFVNTLSHGCVSSSLDKNKSVTFKAFPKSPSGQTPVSYNFSTPSGLYYGLGSRPLAPSAYDIQPQDATYWKIFIRPRHFDSGAGTGSFLGEFDTFNAWPRGLIGLLKATTGILTFRIYYYDANGNNLTRATTDHTFKSESFNDLSSGLVEIDNVARIIGGVTVKRIEVFASLNQQLSVYSASFVA